MSTLELVIVVADATVVVVLVAVASMSRVATVVHWSKQSMSVVVAMTSMVGVPEMAPVVDDRQELPHRDSGFQSVLKRGERWPFVFPWWM